jgi:lactate dehydrogenase-like 2-hydroxyacid dehydrogenase
LAAAEDEEVAEAFAEDEEAEEAEDDEEAAPPLEEAEEEEEAPAAPPFTLNDPVLDALEESLLMTAGRAGGLGGAMVAAARERERAVPFAS